MPELALVLLETELVVDALVDEGLEVTAAAEELVDAFVEEPTLDGVLDAILDATLDGVVVAARELVDAFVEEPALDGVVDEVVETGADADPDEEPDAARAGAAAPARTRR